jgi:hypothetical protein
VDLLRSRFVSAGVIGATVQSALDASRYCYAALPFLSSPAVMNRRTVSATGAPVFALSFSRSAFIEGLT